MKMRTLVVMQAKGGGPKDGDVLLCGDPISGFAVLEALSLKLIAGPVQTIEAAIDVARHHGGAIWQALLDNRTSLANDAWRRDVGDELTLCAPRALDEAEP